MLPVVSPPVMGGTRGLEPARIPCYTVDDFYTQKVQKLWSSASTDASGGLLRQPFFVGSISRPASAHSK